MLLASSSEDGSVYAWDTVHEKLDFSFPMQHSAPCVAVQFSQKNHLLMASAGLDSKLFFYDVKLKKCCIVSFRFVSFDSP